MCFAIGALVVCGLIPQTLFAAPRTCERIFESKGPTLRFTLSGAKLLETAASDEHVTAPFRFLRVAQYSQNEFNAFPEFRIGDAELRTDSVAQSIRRERADVIFLSEIMNHESLLELSRVLDDQYEPAMIEGNDAWGKDVAVLIRKSLPFEVEIQSHRALRNGNYPVFNRDLLVVTLTKPGDTRATISIANSHFKSQKGGNFADVRAAQELVALNALEEVRRQKSPRALMVTGDLNADVRNPFEFRQIKQRGFRDALDVLGIPYNKRVTHTLFSTRELAMLSSQTDAIFISDEIVNTNALTAGYIVVDRTLLGTALPNARSAVELQRRNSDHKMIIVEIDISKLR